MGWLLAQGLKDGNAYPSPDRAVALGMAGLIGCNPVIDSMTYSVFVQLPGR